MIKYNNSNINDWFYNASDIIKVYHNGAIVFYKFDSEQGGYKVCYAVVDDITQYSETEFEDVYDKATEKWYKLNNLVEYEQYGVYGSGRNITYYDGKLTIDDGYEYIYSGSSWVNVGEVSGSTIDTIWIDPPSTNNQNASFTVGHYWGEGYKMIMNTYLSGSYGSDVGSFWRWNQHTPIEFNFYSNGFYYDFHNPTSTTAPNVYTGDKSWRIMKKNSLSSYENSQIFNVILTNGTVRVELEDGTVIVTGSTSVSTKSWYNGLYQADLGIMNASNKCHTSRIQVYNANDELVNDIKFVKNQGATGSQEISAYDSVLNVTYNNTNSYTPSYHIVSESGGTEYPMYYDEIQDPPNNLSFSSMTEAQDYAYNNCVYDGMKATIVGDRYYFDSDNENGWVKMLSYYTVEDVTPGGASGWTITGSSTYNPQPSYYDDFSVVLNSGYQTKVAKVTIYGYENFTYYLRSTGYSSYAYATSSNIDELTSAPTSLDYNSSSAITNTYNFNKSAGSAVNLSNYRRVTYNNIDKTVEHTFYVVFYNGYYTSSYQPSATLLIPKEQTNENWEQVTFSASSNVASSSKNLYIDGNYSTSGGTQYWYYRWMVGLPSGSHSSYTNYSDYSYCPNTTSSTFTSVAGEQRQVNFTYDSVSNKSLQFRLVDTSGNTLSPSDTVYYNYTGYNSCNISSTASNVSMPRSMNVKVGGRFRFANSSNRHYIYGYSPNISFNTDYYVDNYQSTFDITYTKLSEEAVTVTYATYDPSDTETPAFNTDITYPYSGGTTSSTTLASYNVPYTYTYTVKQTNNMFSASTASYTYTAEQASRTITFTLYPNNRAFSTVADLEAYQYAWEGMKASVDTTNYQYENGEWTEITAKTENFVIGDFGTVVSAATDVTEGYYIIYYYGYNSSYADKNYLFSWNSGNTYNGYYTLGNMLHSDTSTSTPISSSEIIDDAVWEFKDAGNGYFYIRNVGTNKYWYYLGANTSYGVPLTDNANDATPVSIQDWMSCLAFVEKQNSNNYPINRLYNYPYRYGWYGSLATDGNNQYYMRKYVP